MVKSMKLKIKYLLASVAFLFVTQSLFASPCSDALTTIEDTLKKPGYGPRSFLSSEPQPTAENLNIASNNGAMWWGNIMKVVSSLDEAKEMHRQRTVGWVGEDTENPLLYAMFIINPAAKEINESLKALADKENRQDLLKSIIEQSEIYQKNYESQSWEVVSKDIINELKTPSINDEADGGLYFYQTGWAKPKYKGVIVFSEMSTSTTLNGKKSKRINKTKKSARNLQKQGFTITVNQDIEASIEAAKNQERKNQVNSGEGRYTKDYIASYVEGLKKGTAYSVELRDPDGNIVAGTFGKILADGSVNGESVFYPPTNNGINYAKVAVFHLINILHNSGHTYMDSGMVTPFTRSSFYGQYITRHEYEDNYSGQLIDKPVDFDFSWDPQSYSTESIF